MPRAAPTSVVEQRITLGTYERNELRRLERQAKIGLGITGLSAVAVPLAIGTAAVAVSLGLAGFGLGNDLDKEAIRNLVLGTPVINRTRRDGSEQEIKNPLFGVPVLGPLFGTGMRLGEASAEATTSLVDQVLSGIESLEDTLKQNISDTLTDLTDGGGVDGGASWRGGGGGGF